MIEKDCFGERECDTVDDCDLDDNAEDVIDLVFSLVLVVALDAVIVGVLRLDKDFFAVPVDDGELVDDDEPVIDAEAVSETEEDKV